MWAIQVRVFLRQVLSILEPLGRVIVYAFLVAELTLKLWHVLMNR